MIWHDEFDGKELDETRWAKRTYMMGKRAEQWVEDAYELDGNGNLVFKLEKKASCIVLLTYKSVTILWMHLRRNMIRRLRKIEKKNSAVSAS